MPICVNLHETKQERDTNHQTIGKLVYKDVTLTINYDFQYFAGPGNFRKNLGLSRRCGNHAHLCQPK